MFESAGIIGLKKLGDSLVKASENMKLVENIHNIEITEIFSLAMFFGSIYMTTVSIRGINKLFVEHSIENKKYLFPFFMMNGSIIVLNSGIIFLCLNKFMKEK
jgi:hypothetical protein